MFSIFARYFSSCVRLNMKPNQSLSKYFKRQIDDIIKSSEDKRLYRGYELTNELQVLLISDSETDKSAASLDVNVGYMCDPVKLPGLAHFCEHMLFMGTKKYPVENDYDNYLSNHGGSSNAYTAAEHTNYFFEVGPDYLGGAIDRFAQFFISPLFKKDAVEREVMAVDSEFHNYIQDDDDRLLQLERTLAKEMHPYRKFDCGNRATLFENPRVKHNLDPLEELIKFYNQFYSSNLMRAVIIGKESLDQLAEMVLPLFNQIENKSLPSLYWPEHAYGPEQVGKRVHVVPVKDLRKLCLYFPTPDFLPHHNSKPEHYVSHLLGHEGSGSLMFELKRRGWLVNDLVATGQPLARGFASFSIEIELTEEGLKNVDEIIVLFFEYLRVTLKNIQPQEWIHREVEKLNNIHFRFADKKNPDEYVSSLSPSLHYYSLKDVLFAPATSMPDFKPQLINELVSFLNPRNLLVIVASKEFQGKTNFVLEHFGVQYSITDLQQDFIDRLLLEESNSLAKNNFNVPVPNEFIPSQFALYSKSSPNSNNLPEIISNDSLSRLWFKQDKEFLTPKCCIFLLIRSPVAYDTPKNFVAVYMLIEMIKDKITDYAYDAKLAGINYHIDNNQYGVFIKIDGFNEKQASYLTKFVDEVIQCQLNAKRFEALKDFYVLDLKNFEKKQPYKQVDHYLDLLLSEKIWSQSELLKEAEGINLPALHNLRPLLFNHVHIESLIVGNTNEKIAKTLLKIAKDSLTRTCKAKPLFSSQIRMNRTLKLPNGCNYVLEIENKTHPNSALSVLFQTDMENPFQNMLIELIEQILCEPLFDQLRTKEQLGYIACSCVRNYYGVRSLQVKVQGQHNPRFMEQRVEAFLAQFEKHLEGMSLEDFQEQKDALATVRLEKKKNLSDHGDKLWDEVYLHQYHFDRDNAEVEVLKSIKQDDILRYFKDHISIDGPKRRKLSVHIYSSEKWAEKRLDCGALGDNGQYKASLIHDIKAFKSSLRFYDSPKPHFEIPTAGIEEAKL